VGKTLTEDNSGSLTDISCFEDPNWSETSQFSGNFDITYLFGLHNSQWISTTTLSDGTLQMIKDITHYRLGNEYTESDSLTVQCNIYDFCSIGEAEDMR